MKVLGIDVGSVSISLVVVDNARNVCSEAYRFHRGNVRKTLTEMISSHVDLTEISAIAATDSTPSFFTADRRYNGEVAIITAAKHDHPNLSGLLHVGGERFSLAAFDENGNYLGSRTNTSCAAGTGSFLDQQAGRLGMQSTAQLSERAEACTAQCPYIASRCAVFAKTDLVHAQQEGYQLEEISEGLCRGLAKNIVDTLFTINLRLGDIIFSGGVSQNRSVARHIESLTGLHLRVADRGHLYGAYGVVLSLLDDLEARNEGNDSRQGSTSIKELFHDGNQFVQDVSEPLELRLSDYPDFNGIEHYRSGGDEGNPVEVDVYKDLQENLDWSVQLGIDIGSTSTKAVLLNERHEVVAGFYTRTAGRPMLAVQSIFREIHGIEGRHERVFTIQACGTTGSGRKFIGHIVKADLIVDEITSHARAAYQLDAEVDTIIEIGGQDAKFTTLVDGRVTSSTINAVCAAGTGSFIEEQANKLGCPVDQVSDIAKGVSAPLASDRCTVFMERDINHLLTEGYNTAEVLAAALHSVRENYLRKVANMANIGQTIFFQGATAKNQALVAAFEQRLNKPILVSKFCHLTGALGTSLLLDDEMTDDTVSSFIGIDLHAREIPIRTEICDLCTNHCKLSVTKRDGEDVAYGFLCGRDYETKHYVKRHTGAFDLAKEHHHCFKTFPASSLTEKEITIGIPAAVHLINDLPLWRRFFGNLGIPTVTSKDYMDGLSGGKKVAGADFCAPITAMHGHIAWLQEQTDYVFLPIYFEEKRQDRVVRRQYCYYTQYLSPLVSTAGLIERQRLLQPLVRYLYSSFHTKIQLFRTLQRITRRRIGFIEISQAYDKAIHDTAECRRRWQLQYEEYIANIDSDQFCVILLGRPYNILSPSLNAGIPRIFNDLNIDTFSLDMVDYEAEQTERIRPLLNELQWHFAANILEVAEVVAQQPGVYPVYLSSFKCSPDSFALDYFKRIMAHYQKPYLICELDEHASRVGYETRIEAACRTFRNHLRVEKNSANSRPIPVSPLAPGTLSGKTLVMPNWDRITCSFLVSTLKGEGVDAVLMEESDQSIRRSLQHNSGQCIPLNAIAQGFMETVDKKQLDPARTLLWMNKSYLACNIRLYPYHIQSILADHGFTETAIYFGQLTFADIGLRAMRLSYFCYFLGGMLRRVACRIRPYEIRQGETDKVLEEAVAKFRRVFETRNKKLEVLTEIIDEFQTIRRFQENRPKVAIFGDLYSRDNRVMNQNLIRFIEAHGGEVITTPYSEYAKMIAGPYFRKWYNEGRYFDVLSNSTALATMKQLEKSYRAIFNRILEEPEWTFEDSPKQILGQFNVAIEHTGESMDNLLKVHYLKKHYPDVALFVQANPALCCPSLVTEAMRERIEEVTGVPVVSVTYDGTGGSKNDVIIPYLRYPRRSKQQEPRLIGVG